MHGTLRQSDASSIPLGEDLGEDAFSLELETCGKYLAPCDERPLDERFASVPRGSMTQERVIRLYDGHTITTPSLRITREHLLEVCFFFLGSGEQSVKILVQNAGDSLKKTFAVAISGGEQNVPNTIRLQLDQFCGEVCRFEITFKAENEGLFDIGVAKLFICRQDHLSRLNALSNYTARLQNEISHFSGTSYTHSMYQEGKITGKEDNAAIERAGHSRIDTASEMFLREQSEKLRKNIDVIDPAPGESVFSYSQRCLGLAIPLTPPDFFARAAELSRGQTLRMLSLCSGAARIEEMVLKHSAGPVELTLFDASEDLLKRSAARFAESGHIVRYLIGDVNDGLPGTGQFDVIVCVSALHHIANLERVISQINVRLSPRGEFWSIGEQIGRNGNRLWPETLEAANRALAKLPEKFRRNSHTGEVDDQFPDDDFSVSCFEGIRSEEISAILEAYLLPVDVYKRNCFLWRLTDTTYCDNYDLTSANDLQHLRELILAEALHWVSGGRGTELHAVYKRKQFL